MSFSHCKSAELLHQVTSFLGRFKRITSKGRVVVTPIDRLDLGLSREGAALHKELVAGAQCKPTGKLEETEQSL
jgi:hypothetical protein